MEFVSSDTNVWIDFQVIARLKLPFLLPYTYIMYTESIDSELLSPLGFRENLLEAKYMTFVHADRKSESSLVIVEARYGGGASLKVTPPLFMYDTAASDCARALSADAQAIYDTCSFEHLKRQQNNKNN